jgi:hypothetical protein
MLSTIKEMNKLQNSLEIIDQYNQNNVKLNLVTLTLKKLMVLARYAQVLVLVALITCALMFQFKLMDDNHHLIGFVALLGLLVFMVSGFYIYRQHLVLNALLHKQSLIQQKMTSNKDQSEHVSLDNQNTHEITDNSPLVEWYFAAIWVLALIISIWH